MSGGCSLFFVGIRWNVDESESDVFESRSEQESAMGNQSDCDGFDADYCRYFDVLESVDRFVDRWVELGVGSVSCIVCV